MARIDPSEGGLLLLVKRAVVKHMGIFKEASERTRVRNLGYMGSSGRGR